MRYLLHYKCYRVLQNALHRDIDQFLRSIDRTVIPEGYSNEFVAFIQRSIKALEKTHDNCKPVDLWVESPQSLDWTIHINGTLFCVRFFRMSDRTVSDAFSIKESKRCN